MLRMSVQFNVYLGWVVFMAGGLLLGRWLTRRGEAMMVNPTLKVTLCWIAYIGAAVLISVALLMLGLDRLVTPAY